MVRDKTDPTPKIAATRLNSTKPTKSQFTPPMMSKANASFVNAFMRSSACVTAEDLKTLLIPRPLKKRGQSNVYRVGPVYDRVQQKSAQQKE
jgi:hypothetical protein